MRKSPEVREAVSTRHAKNRNPKFIRTVPDVNSDEGRQNPFLRRFLIIIVSFLEPKKPMGNDPTLTLEVRRPFHLSADGRPGSDLGAILTVPF